MFIDAWDRGVLLSERRERFCGTFVETGGDRMRAFRIAFAPDKAAVTDWVFQQANKLLADPDIQRRIQEMRDAAMAATLVSIKELVQDWHDIATADPNEIVSHIRTCCRFCWGHLHQYQWTEQQFAQAMDDWQRACEAAAERKGAKAPPMPTCQGGFGFDAKRDPNEICPACYGLGEGRVFVHDTRKLVGKARKLYRGAKESKDGRIEVLLHDQDKARQHLAMVMGAYKDGAREALAPATPAQAPAPAANADEAAKHYLHMVKG